MKQMRISTPAQRLAARREGERRAAESLIQLLCVVSMLRTALTRLLPLAGTGVWWTALLCLLPGLTIFLLTELGCRLTGTDTATDFVRHCLGRAGAALLCGLLGVFLLLEGASGMTALVTLFTEGVGTHGTQLTLALLTGGALLCCLHREGLPRGTVLLRWALLAGAAVAVAAALPDLRMDRLFPLLGGGLGMVREALLTGASMAWPLLLLLTLPREERRPRLQGVCPVVLGVILPLLLICLSIPHEQLVQHASLAESLLTPARYTSSAVRTLILCLVMLAFFLGIAASAQLSADFLSAPLGQPPVWLPYVVLAALILTQAMDVQTLWQVLGAGAPWLLLPLGGLLLACLGIASVRRGRP